MSRLWLTLVLCILTSGEFLCWPPCTAQRNLFNELWELYYTICMVTDKNIEGSSRFTSTSVSSPEMCSWPDYAFPTEEWTLNVCIPFILKEKNRDRGLLVSYWLRWFLFFSPKDNVGRELAPISHLSEYCRDYYPNRPWKRSNDGHEAYF